MSVMSYFIGCADDANPLDSTPIDSTIIGHWTVVRLDGKATLTQIKNGQVIQKDEIARKSLKVSDDEFFFNFRGDRRYSYESNEILLDSIAELLDTRQKAMAYMPDSGIWSASAGVVRLESSIDADADIQMPYTKTGTSLILSTTNPDTIDLDDGIMAIMDIQIDMVTQKE